DGLTPAQSLSRDEPDLIPDLDIGPFRPRGSGHPGQGQRDPSQSHSHETTSLSSIVRIESVRDHGLAGRQARPNRAGSYDRSPGASIAAVGSRREKLERKPEARNVDDMRRSEYWSRSSLRALILIRSGRLQRSKKRDGVNDGETRILSSKPR